MTDPWMGGLLGGTLAVGLLAAWTHRPSVPELDAERWFKIVLATLLRGRCEQEGSSAQEWAERVIREVPYHPAGRRPEMKIDHANRWVPTRGYAPGEQALLERLQRIPDRLARWKHLYLEDEEGMAARLMDPEDLGEAYSFSSFLGGGDGWASISRVGGGDLAPMEALRERVGATWVLVEGRGDLASTSLVEALDECLGDGVRRVPHEEGARGLSSTLLDELCTDRAVVFVGEGVGALRVLDAMVERPALRDRVEAVLAISAPFAGLEGDEVFGRDGMEDWMGAWFGDDTLDTDRVWATPYLSMQWLDLGCTPAGVEGLALTDARFPSPRRGPLRMLEVLELGPLLVGACPPQELIAAALVAVTSGFVLTRRLGSAGSGRV